MAHIVQCVEQLCLGADRLECFQGRAMIFEPQVILAGHDLDSRFAAQPLTLFFLRTGLPGKLEGLVEVVQGKVGSAHSRVGQAKVAMVLAHGGHRFQLFTDLQRLLVIALGFAEMPARRVTSLGLATPPPRELARMLEGSAEEMAVELVRILREEEKAL